MTNGPESADAPRRSRRAAGTGTAAGAQERESQQRARDREALRAYKALTDSQPRPDAADANPPTRRQLRLAQQAAAQQAAAQQAAARKNAPPAEPADRQQPPAAEQRNDAPVSRQGRRDGTAAGQNSAPQPGTRRERRRAAAAADPAAVPAHDAAEHDAAAGRAAAGEAPSGKAASADTSEPAGEPGTAEEPAPNEKAAEASAVQAPVVKPLTPAPQRAPAVREDSAAGAQAAEERQPAPEPNADIANMTVEQALAAREALKHQARNQVAAMEALQQSDPHAVDLELLAQQRALAERAAVLNRRTQNMQRLAQENEQRRSSPSDPTTAHNLAMVTPLEFVEVPGLDRPVMRPPATSHVPVVTSSNPAARKPPAGRMAPAARPGTERRPARLEESAPAARAEVRHSKILARADALVNAPLEVDQGAKPVGARSAFGLDPLDVMTAGLGRTRRIRFVSLGIVGVGLIALTIGVLMIVGGFGS
ncbi:hypothetical protein [Arthrobacter koreensis]|uniref:hypothetical protein n=1 Tax=Arthrobacter koreensis TaxID=199136 RepID=UPI000B3017E0|nr:hypothetical protein [Arthrobacter koreensis]